MMTPTKRFPIAIAAAACMMTQASIASAKDPLTAFVVLGQTGTGEQVALARVVIDKANADCPSLKPVDGGDDKREMVPRTNPDSDNFEVTVCEARYPIDGSSMDVHGTSMRLPGVPQQVSRVTVFGDTGCKPKDQNDCKKNKDSV